MRFSLVVLFAASLASAASVVTQNDKYRVPSCAQPCVRNVDPYPCSHDDKDAVCRCLNPDYKTLLDDCIDGACNDKDAKKAAKAGIKYCKAAGVNPKNPIPKCGVHCLETSHDDKCTPDNPKCWCEDKDFLERVVWCFKDSCKGKDLKTAERVGEGYCKAVGVDVSSIFG